MDVRLGLALGVLSLCCGALSPPRSDAGAGGGAASMSVGGGSAGSSASGGGVATGGAGGSGGAAWPWSYATVRVQPLSGSGSAIRDLGSNGVDTWAVSQGAGMYHLEATGFIGVRVPTTNAITGVYVAPSGAVFAAAGLQLLHCLSNCTVSANWTATNVGNETVQDVCGASASEVYAVGSGGVGRVGIIYAFNGTTWSQLETNLPLTNITSCLLSPDGLFISGQRDVVRRQGSTNHLETADLSRLNQSGEFQAWTSLARLTTGEVMMAGGDMQVARRQGTSWALAYTPMPASTASIFAAAGVGDELWLGTYRDSNQRTLLVFKDNAVRAPPQPPFEHLRAMFVGGPNEVWLGGSANSGDPVIVRATK